MIYIYFYPLLFALSYITLALTRKHIIFGPFIPKPHESISLRLDSSFSSLSHIFDVNSKDRNENAVKTIGKVSQGNYGGKIKHYPPANKEWFNSIYSYTDNTTKLLPSADKTLLKLIKGYFNAYSRTLERRVRKGKSRRSRVRRARLSTNKILVSRAELKHTNDKVIITVYVYNNHKNYYTNKLKKIQTMDVLAKYIFSGWSLKEQFNFIRSKVNRYIYKDKTSRNSRKFASLASTANKTTPHDIYHLFSNKFSKGLYISEFPKPISTIIRRLIKIYKYKNKKNKNKSDKNLVYIVRKEVKAIKESRINFIKYIRSDYNKFILKKLSKRVLGLKAKMGYQEKALSSHVKNNGFLTNVTYDTHKKNLALVSKVYNKNYMRAFVFKLLRKEIVSVYFKQLLKFNKLKFENRYTHFLENEINKIYNKNVEFNFVNLKYLYLSGSIFSSTLLAKIRNRKNRFLRVLKDSLLMFNLPPIDRQAVYDEIYNKKKVVENLGLINLLRKNRAPHLNQYDNTLMPRQSNSFDVLEKSFFTLMPEITSKLNNDKNTPFTIDFSDKLASVITALKHKSVKGIRLELAGRLTKRNTAARSLFKLRYKGNIKNIDSSDKGLSTVMLRGHSRSNLEFSRHKSKIRIGSYGLKGWVSTS